MNFIDIGFIYICLNPYNFKVRDGKEVIAIIGSDYGIIGNIFLNNKATDGRFNDVITLGIIPIYFEYSFSQFQLSGSLVINAIGSWSFGAPLLFARSCISVLPPNRWGSRWRITPTPIRFSISR